MKIMKVTTLWIFSSMLTACTQGLAFKGISASDSAKANTPTATCQPGVTAVTLPVKFLFIVDQSGSNFDGPYEHPGVATDPLKNFRFGVINAFFQQQASKPSVQWGFETFNGSAAKALINSGNAQAPIFSSETAMSSALQTFLTTPDVGQTPYKAALQMAHDMIQQDIASSLLAYQYRIAFLTDGYPTDYLDISACPVNSTAVTCPGVINDAAINADVQSIISLSPASIQISTVYYGLPDASAAARLENMASVGKGQFVDTNVSKNLSLDDVIQVPTVCPAAE